MVHQQEYRDNAVLPTIRIKAMEPYEMGFTIGQRCRSMIRERIVSDKVLQTKLLPFVASEKGKDLIQVLIASNKERYPRYWTEMHGIADGSGTPFLEVVTLNFRKEITSFLPDDGADKKIEGAEDCSDLLLCSHNLALIAHNEDANVSVRKHTYLLYVTLQNGMSFFAYTYAGELPTCAFGFNSHGVAFTLNAVPPAPEEVVAGGIGRNLISRDLLEAENIADALQRVKVASLSVGHSYNLLDLKGDKILNVETASKKQFSVLEIGGEAFFHANMYLHLQVQQIPNQSSYHRQLRASQLLKSSTEHISIEHILAILGDKSDCEYPIYMDGPDLYTLCTVIFDLQRQTMTLYHKNSKFHTPILELPLNSSIFEDLGGHSSSVKNLLDL